VAALVAYASGPYQQQFGTASLTVAVVATAGARRRDELVRWTEAELAAGGRVNQAGLFCVTGVPVVAASPETFFAHAVWRTPFEGRPGPLLDLSNISDRWDISDRCEMAETWERAERGAAARKALREVVRE